MMTNYTNRFKLRELISRVCFGSTRCISGIIIAISLAFAAHAEQSSQIIDELWDFADLVENQQGDYLKLSGRLQLDAIWLNSKQGDYNDTLWRRFRFGFKGKRGEFTAALEADLNLNNALADAYNRLTDANINWAVNKATSVKFLKQSTGFTLDGKTSSKKLLTPQRNNLTNNLWFTSEYFTGISVKSRFNEDWSYKTGIFSSDASDEIGISDASYFAMFSTNKSLSKNAFWQKGDISFDYVYNDTHEEGNTREFSHVLSTSSKFIRDKWGFQSDISWGNGDLGQSDIFGVVVMPTFQQRETLQWVARYTYLHSSENNGVRADRYEKNVVTVRGDKYQEVYAGLNWLLNKHKLKLQTGVQYSKMHDKANDGGAYDGWRYTIAFRSYW